MADFIEYKVKIGGDTSELGKTLKKFQSKLEHLTDDDYIVHLSYDRNIKELNKQIDWLEKTNLDLPVNFRYDVNKAALQKEMKTLSSLEDKRKEKISETFSVDNIGSIISQIGQEFEATGKYTTKVEQLYHKILNIFKTMVDNPQTFDINDTKLTQIVANWKSALDVLKYNLNDDKEFEVIQDNLQEWREKKAEDILSKTTATIDIQIERQKKQIAIIEQVLSGITHVDDRFSETSPTMDSSKIDEQLKNLQSQIDEAMKNFKIPDSFKNDLEELNKQITELGELIHTKLFNENDVTNWKNAFAENISAIGEILGNMGQKSQGTDLFHIFRGMAEADNLQTMYGISGNREAKKVEQFVNTPDKTVDNENYFSKDSINKLIESGIETVESRLRERGMYINPTTSEHTNEYVFDAPYGFNYNLKSQGKNTKYWADNGYTIGHHTHPTTNSGISLIQRSPQGDIEGDLLSFFSAWKDGITKQINSAVLDISVFDVDKFFTDNPKIAKELENKSIIFKAKALKENDEINENSQVLKYNYLESFIDKFGTNKDFSNEALIKNLMHDAKNKSIDQNVEDELLKYYASQEATYLYEGIINQFKTTRPNEKELDKSILEIALEPIYEKYEDDETKIDEIDKWVNSKAKGSKLFEKTFGFQSGTFAKESRDGLKDFAFQQLIPDFFKKVFNIDNFQDYFKTYTYDEFEKQDPLGFKNISNQKENTSVFQNLTQILDSIKISLNTIAQSLSSNNIVSGLSNEDKQYISQLITALSQQTQTVAVSSTNIKAEDIANENQLFSQLFEMIQKVNGAIAEKNQLLKDEGEIVRTDINGELSTFGMLASYLNTIYTTLSSNGGKPLSIKVNLNKGIKQDELDNLQSLAIALQGVQYAVPSLEKLSTINFDTKFINQLANLGVQLEKFATIDIKNNLPAMQQFVDAINKLSQTGDLKQTINALKKINNVPTSSGVNPSNVAFSKDIRQLAKSQLNIAKINSQINLEKEKTSPNATILQDLKYKLAIEQQNAAKVAKTLKSAGVANYQTDVNNINATSLQDLAIKKEKEHVKIQNDITKQNEKAAKAYQKLTENLAEYYALIYKTDKTKDEQLLADRYKKTIDDAKNKAGVFSFKDNGDKNSKIADSALNIISNRDKEKEALINYLLNLIKPFQDSTKYADAFVKKIADLRTEINNLKDVNISDLYQRINNTISNPSTKIREAEIRKPQAEIAKILYDSSSMSIILQSQFKDLAKAYQNLFDSNAPKEALDALDVRFEQLKEKLHETGYYGKSVFNSTIEAIKNRGQQFFAQYLSLQDFIRYFRSAITYVTELDSALNELKIVSNASATELNKVSSSAFELANDLGSTTTTVLSSITDWRRLGKSIDDSLTLAEQSAKLSTGGFMEVSTATEALTSSIQAFNIQVADSSKLVDQFIYLGNNYAITSEELATSLEVSSAALVAAGNSLEEAEALEIAGNTTMQDPDAVSNALKVVSMRLRGTTASELEAEGEDTDGLIKNASKLYKTIKNLTKTQSNPEGVSIINETTGAYKSTYEILKEIANVYDEMDDANQAALLESIAGKTRGSAVAAILQNADVLENAYTDALENSAGAGEKALETGLDSIEKKYAVFQNSLQKVAQDAIDSGFIKDVIDSGTEIVDFLDKMINQFGLLIPLLTTVSTLTGVAGKNPIVNQVGSLINVLGITRKLKKSQSGLVLPNDDDAIKKIRNGTFDITKTTKPISSTLSAYYNQQQALGKPQDTVTLGGFSAYSLGTLDTLGKLSQAVKTYNELLAQGNGEQSSFINQLMLTNSTAGTYFKSLKNAKASLVGLTVKTIAQTVAQTAMNAAVTMGVSAVIALVSAGLQAAWTAFSENVIHRVENAKEKVAEVTSEVQTLIDEMKSLSDESDNITTFSKLAQGVDLNTGENKTLSDSDYDKFLSVSNEIHEAFGDLPVIYDKQGNAIVQIKGTTEQISKTLTEILRQQREEKAKEILNKLSDSEYQSSRGTVRDANKRTQEEYEYHKTLYEDYSQMVKSSGVYGGTEEEVAYAKELVNTYINNALSELGLTSAQIEAVRNGNTSGIDVELLPQIENIKEQAKRIYADNLTDFSSEYKTKADEEATYLSEHKDEYTTAVKAIEDDNIEFTNLLKQSLDAYGTDYQDLTAGQQSFVQNIVGGFSGDMSWDEADASIQDILAKLNDPNSEAFSLWTKYLSLDDPEEKQKIITQLKSLFNDDNIKVSLDTIFQNDTETQRKVQEVINSITDVLDKKKLSDYFDENIGYANAEAFLQVIQDAGAETVDAMILAWEGSLSSLPTYDFEDFFGLEDAEEEATNLSKLSNEVDTLQNAYKTLYDAMDEYNEDGKLSVDTVQSIIELGGDYLQYLFDENGNFKLNEESLRELTQARLEDMRVQALNTVIDNAAQATDDANAQKYLASTSYEAAEAATSLAQASAEATIALLREAVAAGALSQSNMDSVVSKMYSDMANINKLFDNIDISAKGLGATTDEGEEQDYKDLLDKEIDLLEKQLQAGYIDFNEYIQKRADLIQDYYDKGLIDAEEYYTALEDMYENQLDYYDKVISAVEKVIDDKIDAYEDEQDAIDDQIDALNEANDAREKAIDLQKKAYELARAENQRTKLVYKNGQMQYMTDPTDIRDAKEELEDAEFDKQVGELEKQKDVIQDTIDALEEYKEKWSEISSIYDDMQNASIAASVLGDNWENVILSMNPDVFEEFKDNYVDLQNQIAEAAVNAANQVVESAKRISDAGSGGGGGYDNNKTVVSGTLHDIEAINTITGQVQKFYNISDVDSFLASLGSSWVLLDDIKSSQDEVNGKIDETSEKTYAVIENLETGHTVWMGNLEDADEAFQGLSTNIQDQLVLFSGTLDEIQVKIKYALDDYNKLVNHSGDDLIKGRNIYYSAYASGTSGLQSSEKNALRSEYGQPELTIYPNGQYELTTKPTVSDLPKGTVIYNGEQTKKILKNNGKGKAFANGTNEKLTSLQAINPDKFRMLNSMVANMGTVNVSMQSIDNMLTTAVKGLILATNASTVSHTPVINMNNTFECNGVTVDQVKSQIAGSFEGLMVKAYQKVMR